MIKGVLERLLEEELEEHTQAQRYERKEERLDYRNGRYRRVVVTEFGVVEVDKPRGRDRFREEFRGHRNPLSKVSVYSDTV